MSPILNKTKTGAPLALIAQDPRHDVLMTTLFGSRETLVPVPRGAVLPGPPQDGETSTARGLPTRPPVPRMSVPYRPLENSQVTSDRSLKASDGVPRASVFPRPL